MTEKIIHRLVNSFLKYGFIVKEQKDAYIYSLLCFSESVITVGSIILISLIAGKVIPAVFFCLYFFSLRNRTGGIHFNSFLKCFAGSLLLFVLVIIYGNIALGFQRKILWIVTIFSAFVIWIIGAVNHVNMNMNAEEIAAAKKAARLVLGMEMCLLVFMEYLKADALIIIYSCCGIILCAILLIIAKFAGQEVKMHE